MSKTLREHRVPLQKHLINLYAGDMDKLKDMYPGGGSVIVRKLVRLHIHQVTSRVLEKVTEKELAEDE